jgi:hypothetical protein
MRLSRICNDTFLRNTLRERKILDAVAWVSRGDDFDPKPINFHPRRNPPLKGL